MLGKKEIVRRSEPSSLVPWTPFFPEMQEFRSFLSEALEDFFAGDGHQWRMDLWGGRQWTPAVDVEEKEKEYVFSVELPGLEKDDFRVEMQNGTLTISGERREKKEEKSKNYLRHEQYYGAFRRSFNMPADASPEGIKAVYKNGILKVSVARSEKAKPVPIPISVE